jgi:HTH-type transcriptional regulator, glycine betaine synthesis regulator
MSSTKSLKTTKGGSMPARIADAASGREAALDGGSRGGQRGGTEEIEHLLTPFQLEAVSLFVHAFSALSLPRSIGEIYGLLFSTEEPLSLDDVVEKLQLSRGSVNEGLRWLRTLGAVSLVYRPGVRKEHFTAETSLRKLASGYLRERIDPHLENGGARLEALEASIDGQSSTAAFEKSRLGQVKSWYGFFGKILPVIKTLAAKF